MEIPDDLDELDPVDEALCDRAKAGWRGRHRWMAPPPPICANLAGDVSDVTVGQVVAAIRGQPDAPVLLTITSAGGCPVAAMACYNLLRAHAAPVTIHVPERCSSAAVLLLLGADSRTASRNAKFLLHTAEYVIARVGRNTAALLRDNAQALDVIDQEMAAIIGLRAARYAHWQLAADLAAETVLDAHQAWLRGLLTESPK
jgi:ATP-dependent protease ClpP protease subunit